jgi:tetratricopeptide (TPR) repeat protein
MDSWSKDHSIPSMHVRIVKIVLLSLVASLLWLALPAFAQRPSGNLPQQGLGGAPTPTFTTLLVSVRDPSGGPLPTSALVRISSNFTQIRMTAATQDGGAASFPGIPVGDYDVVAEAPGYVTATERASLLGGAMNFTVYVYLHPEGDVTPTDPHSGKPRMSPRLQSEIDKGFEKLRKQQFDQVRTHFEKAEKMAPGNPDVQYLIGMMEYQQAHYEQARARFEKALSIYPTHERALVLLGELQLRSGESAKAVQTLEKAFQVNGADWRVHYLLGSAYASQKDYEKAFNHAQRATQLSKGQFPTVQVLMGRILLQQGKRDEARAAFTAVAKSYPNDPAAKDAQTALVQMDRPALVAMNIPAAARPGSQPATSENVGLGGPAEAAPGAVATPEAVAPAPTTVLAALVPSIPVLVRPWSPPDIDSREYVLARDVACSEDDVVKRTGARTLKQLENFEKFSATEHIEHQEIDINGNPVSTRNKDFTYMVFVERAKSDWLFLNEDRDGDSGLSEFPTSLATRGLVGLGVFFFSPEYQSDFNYQCEGLGEWRGQAAWQVRLEQKKEVPSRVMTWRNRRGVFPVPLRARIWVAANTYDVVHIETDLRDPVTEIELSMEHLVIDYGLVNFEHGNTSLWLPWHADMYMQLHSKRYHHRHTLTNYALFSVDTDHQISAPKNLPREQSQDPPPKN